mgnify:CR=1 FL=1
MESECEKPRVWVVLEGRAGDDVQLINLAEALGLPYARTSLHGGLMGVLRDRLIDAMGVASKPWRLHWPEVQPPELVLFTGGRALSVGRRLRRESGGRTRLVNLGRPWGAPDGPDLIITTPQYRLPERTNIVQNLLPLNRPRQDRLDEAARHWRAELTALPAPRQAVLVGGSSGSYTMSAHDGECLAERAGARCRNDGGSLLVATSRRTPPEAARALFAGLDVPYHGYRWDDPSAGENPYVGYLALADRFLVTGESASMLADACNSGRPVEVFPLRERWHTRLFTSRFRAQGFGGMHSGWMFRLMEKGLWMPARDLSALHAALAAAGLINNEAGGDPPYENDLERAREAIWALLTEGHQSRPTSAPGRAESASPRGAEHDVS